jgi:hypothetical protein
MEQVSGSDSGGPGATQADTKKVVACTSDLRVVAKKTMMAMGSSSSNSGGSKAVQVGVEKAPEAMPGLKTTAKRATTVTGSSGSITPHKQFHTTWTCQGPSMLCIWKVFFFLPFVWVY